MNVEVRVFPWLKYANQEREAFYPKMDCNTNVRIKIRDFEKSDLAKFQYGTLCIFRTSLITISFFTLALLFYNNTVCLCYLGRYNMDNNSFVFAARVSFIFVGYNLHMFYHCEKKVFFIALSHSQLSIAWEKITLLSETGIIT